MKYLVFIATFLSIAFAPSGASTVHSECQNDYNNDLEHLQQFKNIRLNQCQANFDITFSIIQQSYKVQQMTSHSDIDTLKKILESCSKDEQQSVNYFECLWKLVS